MRSGLDTRQTSLYNRSVVKQAGSARERLLEAADELFYREGVHTVGIDRVLEKAGVAKASLYGTFGSKDELVRAYLEGRSLRIQERTMKRLATLSEPRARLLAIFDLLAERVADGSFRGCAFVNACAEGPAGPTPPRAMASGHRTWLPGLAELARDAGVRDPVGVGRRLALLDGALIGASMDGDPAVPAMAAVWQNVSSTKARRSPPSALDQQAATSHVLEVAAPAGVSFSTT